MSDQNISCLLAWLSRDRWRRPLKIPSFENKNRLNKGIGVYIVIRRVKIDAEKR